MRIHENLRSRRWAWTASVAPASSRAVYARSSSCAGRSLQREPSSKRTSRPRQDRRPARPPHHPMCREPSPGLESAFHPSERPREASTRKASGPPWQGPLFDPLDRGFSSVYDRRKGGFLQGGRQLQSPIGVTNQLRRLLASARTDSGKW